MELGNWTSTGYAWTLSSTCTTRDVCLPTTQLAATLSRVWRVWPVRPSLSASNDALTYQALKVANCLGR